MHSIPSSPSPCGQPEEAVLLPSDARSSASINSGLSDFSVLVMQYQGQPLTFNDQLDDKESNCNNIHFKQIKML